jgi:hypothetical protein
MQFIIIIIVIIRFLLSRTGNTSWVAMVVSKSTGHAFDLSIPRPVSNSSTNPNSLLNQEGLMLMACPDESSRSLSIWTVPAQLPLSSSNHHGACDIELGRLANHNLKGLAHPILSVVLAPFNSGGGEGRGLLRVVTTSAESVCIYRMDRA